MSNNATITKTLALAGMPFNMTTTVAAEAALVQEVSVPRGFEGTLTTRTDANTGVITIDDSAHNFVQGNRVDLYWANGSRRGMSVTNVTGSAVTIDGGAGTDLPNTSTEVTLIRPVALDFVIKYGDNIVAAMLHSAQQGMVTFVDENGAEVFNKKLGAARGWEWESGCGDENPFDGTDIAVVYLSHANVAITAATMKVGVAYNN